jgi:small subunit ribosomal protein S8e
MNKGRKISSGKYRPNRKLRLHERLVQERQSTLGKTKRKALHARGGHYKQILLTENKVNVSTGKQVKKTDIINVIETPQNKFLARQNRLMKGAIIETSLGKARITNRPSQEGMINAILIK